VRNAPGFPQGGRHESDDLRQITETLMTSVSHTGRKSALLDGNCRASAACRSGLVQRGCPGDYSGVDQGLLQRSASTGSSM